MILSQLRMGERQAKCRALLRPWWRLGLFFHCSFNNPAGGLFKIKSKMKFVALSEYKVQSLSGRLESCEGGEGDRWGVFFLEWEGRRGGTQVPIIINNIINTTLIIFWLKHIRSAHYLSANCVIFTYYTGDVAKVNTLLLMSISISISIWKSSQFSITMIWKLWWWWRWWWLWEMMMVTRRWITTSQPRCLQQSGTPCLFPRGWQSSSQKTITITSDMVTNYDLYDNQQLCQQEPTPFLLGLFLGLAVTPKRGGIPRSILR